MGLDNAKTDIITGLLAEKKYISSKYFYDSLGSALFEEITRLDEYYLTRTEKSILKNLCNQPDFDLSHTDIIDLGSGGPQKIEILFRHTPVGRRKNIRYYPVDISPRALKTAARYLKEKFPWLRIEGVVTDFINKLELIPKNKQKRLFCFFGSTIGNLSREQGKRFCRKIESLMAAGDVFLLGLDMVKDQQILFDAYNDRQNITARFNKNILNVVNNLIETAFNPDLFQHLAFYNPGDQRIEMHLEALTDMTVDSGCTQQVFELKKGETIHTENSHKFTKQHIREFQKASGLKARHIHSDKNRWFSLVELVKTEGGCD